MDLSDVQVEAHRTAVARGQWPDHSRESVIAALMHAVNELCEVYRDVHAGGSLAKLSYVCLLGGTPKPVGAGVELADVVINCASIAEAVGVDLATTVALKLAYNRTRIADADAG